MTEQITLEEAKVIADEAGISYHPSIGLENLLIKIENHEAEEVNQTPEETTAQRNKRIKDTALQLVRVNVACLNPAKKEWEGEIFTTGNSITGTVKKYVPFNVDYHVPRIILEMMQDRQCQVFYSYVDPTTKNKTRKGKLIKEFGINILADLTKEELDELAQRQAMAAGTAA